MDNIEDDDIIEQRLDLIESILAAIKKDIDIIYQKIEVLSNINKINN